MSRYVFVLCAAIMCYASFSFYPRWKQSGTEAAISWDVSGYYWYLPSVFIYHDLKHQSFKDSILNKYRPTNLEFQQGTQVDNGNYVMKYSSGMAVMYLPFFTAAHLLAAPLGYPKDGFSLPYQFAIQIGGFLVSILGLWYLRKLLLNFYNDKVVAIVLVLLAIGSNYLNYGAIDMGMSHCWLFTVYVFLLLNTFYFYRDYKLKYAIRVGLLVGLATLTRPTDVISCLIPLLWGMESISVTAIKKQLSVFAAHAKSLAIAVICAGAVIAIQLSYWKYVSGHWFVYSYGGQNFSWKHPNTFLYSFNYRTGWLTYTPVMMLAVIGIIPFVKNGHNKVAILTFIFINYYIVSAWDIWWYGGRAMVQSYPLFMFPLATLVSAALDRKLLAWILTPIAILFLYMNIWITYQYHRGRLYDSDNMTKNYYWRVAGRWSTPEKTSILQENVDLFEGTPKDLRAIYEQNFRNDTGALYVPHKDSTGKSLRLDKDHQLSDTYRFPFDGKNATWVRVQGTFHCSEKEYDIWKMTQFVVRLMNKDKVVKENMLRVYHFLDKGQTKDLSLDMELPSATFDSVNIFIWNAGSEQSLLIDDLKAWSFKD